MNIKAKFEITNKTENTIDSINIKSFDHGVNPNYLKLDPGESKMYLFDMTDLPKVDGDYLLTFKGRTENIERKKFGYFTNGYPSEKLTKIEIRKDTLIFEHILKEY